MDVLSVLARVSSGCSRFPLQDIDVQDMEIVKSTMPVGVNMYVIALM